MLHLFEHRFKREDPLLWDIGDAGHGAPARDDHLRAQIARAGCMHVTLVPIVHAFTLVPIEHAFKDLSTVHAFTLTNTCVHTHFKLRYMHTHARASLNMITQNCPQARVAMCTR
eukprot:258586-Pleurochrysis_carterae.AAC.1